MRGLNYNQLGESLVETIPELRDRYEEELRYWGEEGPPGPHTIFSEVLLPFLDSWLHQGERTDLVQRVFAFLERMASQPDEKIKEVLILTVINSLKERESAKKYMGSCTRQMVDEFDRWRPSST